MRLNAFLLASCLLAVALSGCTEEAPDDPADLQDDAQDPQDDLQSDLVEGNRAPLADLTASLSNGTAPLNVTFTLDGSDADGDNLTWSFDAGDGNTTANGTSLPASVDATYGVGNWTATFTVSDGQNSTVETFLVAVAAGAPAVPAVPQEAIVIEGSITGAYVGEGGITYTSQNDHPFEVTQVARKMTVSLEWGPTAVDLDYEVVAPDGTVAASQANYNDPTGMVLGPAGEPDSEITDPALLSQVGTWTLVVLPGEAVEADYTVTITFE